MTKFLSSFFAISPFSRKFFRRFFLFLSICILSCFSACAKPIDYFSYVSELRDNIFLAQTENFALKIYSVAKESPYSSDGVPREVSQRTEVYFTAPSGDKEYELNFSVNGNSYGGTLSYDNVKGEYYYFCTLDISACKEIECTFSCGEENFSMLAQSVKTENTLSPRHILQTVQENEPDLFSSLTDEYGFAGEIYIRLIFEEFPYYYAGVTDRNGNVTAFLLNGETGKILARRQS